LLHVFRSEPVTRRKRNLDAAVGDRPRWENPFENRRLRKIARSKDYETVGD
jgi:hypothetical protein